MKKYLYTIYKITNGEKTSSLTIHAVCDSKNVADQKMAEAFVKKGYQVEFTGTQELTNDELLMVFKALAGFKTPIKRDVASLN